jgi:hypothetical protein
MAQTVAGFLLIVVSIYLSIGFVFAILFAFRWVDKFDDEASGAPLLFRLLIIPASTLLWIYLLKRVREKKKS